MTHSQNIWSTITCSSLFSPLLVLRQDSNSPHLYVSVLCPPISCEAAMKNSVWREFKNSEIGISEFSISCNLSNFLHASSRMTMCTNTSVWIWSLTGNKSWFIVGLQRELGSFHFHSFLIRKFNKRNKNSYKRFIQLSTVSVHSSPLPYQHHERLDSFHGYFSDFLSRLCPSHG